MWMSVLAPGIDILQAGAYPRRAVSRSDTRPWQGPFDGRWNQRRRERFVER
jgi:hypothetical protein